MATSPRQLTKYHLGQDPNISNICLNTTPSLSNYSISCDSFVNLILSRLESFSQTLRSNAHKLRGTQF